MWASVDDYLVQRINSLLGEPFETSIGTERVFQLLRLKSRTAWLDRSMYTSIITVQRYLSNPPYIEECDGEQGGL